MSLVFPLFHPKTVGEEASHSEDAEVSFLYRSVESGAQAETQDEASVSRVDDSIIPQPKRTGGEERTIRKYSNPQ